MNREYVVKPFKELSKIFPYSEEKKEIRVHYKGLHMGVNHPGYVDFGKTLRGLYCKPFMHDFRSAPIKWKPFGGKFVPIIEKMCELKINYDKRNAPVIKMVTLSFPVPEEFRNKINAHAEKNKITSKDYLLEMIHQHIKRYKL